MLGRKADEVIHSEASHAPGSADDVAADGEPARPLIGRHRRNDGSWFDSEVISAPILEDGEVVGAVVVFRDITERREVDRMKDEFISMVSHELRTPLTSIRGALGLLGSGDTGELAPHAARMVEVATMSTDRLIRLINDILEVERMAAGKLVVNLRTASARTLIQATVEEMTGLAQSSGVHIRIGEVEGNVSADPDLIVQTLSNLLGNAVKFSEAGDTVELRATLEGGEVHFEVTGHRTGRPAGPARGHLRALQPGRRVGHQGEGRQWPRPRHLPRAGRASWRADLGHQRDRRGHDRVLRAHGGGRGAEGCLRAGC